MHENSMAFFMNLLALHILLGMKLGKRLNCLRIHLLKFHDFLWS